jgi:hypothetical protein
MKGEQRQIYRVEKRMDQEMVPRENIHGKG